MTKKNCLTGQSDQNGIGSPWVHADIFVKFEKTGTQSVPETSHHSDLTSVPYIVYLRNVIRQKSRRLENIIPPAAAKTGAEA